MRPADASGLVMSAIWKVVIRKFPFNMHRNVLSHWRTMMLPLAAVFRCAFFDPGDARSRCSQRNLCYDLCCAGIRSGLRMRPARPTRQSSSKAPRPIDPTGCLSGRVCPSLWPSMATSLLAMLLGVVATLCSEPLQEWSMVSTDTSLLPLPRETTCSDRSFPTKSASSAAHLPFLRRVVPFVAVTARMLPDCADDAPCVPLAIITGGPRVMPQLLVAPSTVVLTRAHAMLQCRDGGPKWTSDIAATLRHIGRRTRKHLT